MYIAKLSREVSLKEIDGMCYLAGFGFYINCSHLVSVSPPDNCTAMPFLW